MADGRIRRHGRREHSYEQRDGGWWDRGDPVSHENLLRYFGKDQLLQNEGGKWDFNRAREDSLTNKQKRERFDYEMDYDKFPYDRSGNRFVRDPNAPLSKFEQLENEMEGMMGDMRGKGFWEPTQNNPYLPKDRGSEWRDLQADIEKSGEINRGSGFGRANYGFGDYEGKSWSSPEPFYKLNTNQYNIPYPSYDMSPSFSNRTKSNYLEPHKPGKLNQLSPSGINNYNSGGWNSGMKDWR